MVRAQVDARHEQQGVVGVELRELGVAPVKLPHAGAVHQRDIAICALCVPQLHKKSQKMRFRKGVSEIRRTLGAADRKVI